MELSYISGNGNAKKIPYISGNVIFLYFRKLLIFQEVTFRAPKVKRKNTIKKFLTFRRNGTF